MALKTLDEVEKVLKEYYKKFGKPYDNQLSEFMDDSGFEFDDLLEDLDIDDDDADECTIVTDFDDDFPLNSSINRNDTSAVKKAMFEKMKYIVTIGVAPAGPPSSSSSTSSFLSVNDIKIGSAHIKKQDVDAAKKLYKNQTPAIFKQCAPEPDVMNLLTIRMKNHNFPFAQTMHDAFTRDKINAEFNNKKGPSIFLWLTRTKLGTQLNKTNKTEAAKLSNGMQGFANRICPVLGSKPATTIDDDPEEIANYVASASQLVKKLIEKEKTTPPFHIDMIIAVKNVKSNMVAAGDDDDDDSDDSDDDDDDDDKKDQNDDKKDQNDDPDDIGDVKAKLVNAKCSFSNKIIDASMLSRPLDDIYAVFRSCLKKSNNKPPSGDKGYHKPFDNMQYPHQKRFNIFIDRRSRKHNINNNISTDNNQKDKNHIPTDDVKDQRDDATIFEPPYKYDTLPSGKHGYAPEWFFEASRECLIPSGDPAAKNITVTDACGSKIITFSFHVESAEKIKCYMFWNAQVTRFYPEDIVKVFKFIFNRDQYDTFIGSDVIEEIYKNIYIKDKQFETFYRELTNKNAFPDPKFIVDYAKKERQHTELMIQFLDYAIQKLGTKDNDNNFGIKFESLCNDIMFQAIIARPYLGLCGTLFAAKAKKKIKYTDSSIILRAPDSNDVLITMDNDKAGDTPKIKVLIKKHIGKRFDDNKKDNLVYLLNELHKGKDAYTTACAIFKNLPITEKRST